MEKKRSLTSKTFTFVNALILCACEGGGGIPYGGREGEDEVGEGEAEGDEREGGSTCGNGECELGEAVEACPADCDSGRACGNGSCDAGEDGSNCSLDCGSMGVAPCHVQRTGSQKVGTSLPLGVGCGSVHFASCSCAECEAVWEASQTSANWAKECGSLGGGAYFPNGCDDPNCSFSGTLCANVAAPLLCTSEPCCALDSLCGDGECVSGGEEPPVSDERCHKSDPFTGAGCGWCCCPEGSVSGAWRDNVCTCDGGGTPQAVRDGCEVSDCAVLCCCSMI